LKKEKEKGKEKEKEKENTVAQVISRVDMALDPEPLVSSKVHAVF